ncbi:hypothetical protein FRACYDRAFT_240701 [Fragilariopsis cylindrus CCMP1102]|uniref:Uncharacterized protein n=1 Tax=Fragilariopsis cylindrus CCMP1102 TaxID=635003 RepID=A0A1E7F7N4_9STRA|nr:hypothetical protein FRACYDRAFT_240701 [Fragilariopsis cylindrus CCMP1102]|eukprot:OEU14170.1 hypothetical protein FRACYDRAFT_240701 [Fragilariopsis cylindrus CCMP1102]
MLFKNSVFVIAAMHLLSPFTVVSRTLKADKSANKCEKRFEETIDALTTRIDRLTMLVEQIATSVGNNGKNDSAIAEFCVKGVAANFNGGAAAPFTPDECVDACILLLGDIANNTLEKCTADCVPLFGGPTAVSEFTCNTFCRTF